MGKIVKLSAKTPEKFGLRQARKRKKLDLEDYGQLNLFTANPPEARVIRFNSHMSPFEEALQMDDRGDKSAREFYWKAVKSGDCTADAYCNLGILESEDNNFIQAIDCFTNALKHNSRHFEAHYNLANIYSDAGDLNLARLHYEVAATLEPRFSNVYYNLGLVHALNKDFQAATEALLKYKEMAPEEESSKADELIRSLRKSLRNIK